MRVAADPVCPRLQANAPCPAPFLLRAAREAAPPADLSKTLVALGDANRLRALKLIAERPRSTQELAALSG